MGILFPYPIRIAEFFLCPSLLLYCVYVPLHPYTNWLYRNQVEGGHFTKIPLNLKTKISPPLSIRYDLSPLSLPWPNPPPAPATTPLLRLLSLSLSPPSMDQNGGIWNGGSIRIRRLKLEIWVELCWNGVQSGCGN